MELDERLKFKMTRVGDGAVSEAVVDMAGVAGSYRRGMEWIGVCGADSVGVCMDPDEGHMAACRCKWGWVPS